VAHALQADGLRGQSIIEEMIAGFDIVFLLWRELCKLAGYVDESITDEMITGLDIVGTDPTSPAFHSQLVPATFTVQDLERHAPLAQASLLSAMRNIFETFSLGPEFFAGHRFMDKAQNLEQDELKLHRTFSREVEAIFKDKKVLPWRELRKLTGYVKRVHHRRDDRRLRHRVPALARARQADGPCGRVHRQLDDRRLRHRRDRSYFASVPFTVGHGHVHGSGSGTPLHWLRLRS
jgi:hypothetical protein